MSQNTSGYYFNRVLNSIQLQQPCIPAVSCVNIWCRRLSLRREGRPGRRVPEAARGPPQRTGSSRAVASLVRTTHTKGPKKPGHLSEAAERQTCLTWRAEECKRDYSTVLDWTRYAGFIWMQWRPHFWQVWADNVTQVKSEAKCLLFLEEIALPLWKLRRVYKTGIAQTIKS